MSLLSRPYGICVIAAFAAGACSGNFDTTRERRPFEDRATLGQEIFGALCDRLGASALAEDLDGESYNALCHPDGEGRYRSTVDSSLLPPIREGTPVAAMARNLGVAKMEALARRRQDLVKSFDTILPDVEIHDPFAPHGGPTKVRLHTAVAELLQRLNPLYDSNPLAAEGGTPDPLLPASTQALARVFQALIASEDARVALQKIGGRKGYRPLSSALGVIAPVLAYPDLRKISQQTVRVLSPGGPAREQFVQLLTVAQEELRTAETRQCKDEPDRCQALAPTDNRAQPNRYRRNLEILQDIAFMPDNAFGLPGLSSGPIVRRDYRGFAQASGSQLGVPGSVPTPFSDADQDGLADVDDFGRFIDIHGNLVSVDPPFVVPGEPLIREPNEIAKLDNGEPAYKSIDTTKTMLASLLLRDLPALLNPDPAAQHETLLDALAGLVPLLGDRADAIYAYGEGNEQVGIKYRQFVPSTSPLLALVH
ncbi:MAG: hypothetical protein MUF54_12640, partial [Polyangiaceae bacterium]|nr:hypothetical protein [Polyangiaceae bacterium]